ncbi:DUF4861 domain-containing protein [Thermophagus xiamenensis]|uniref:DUF4861 domain-containing protein n=1 Tax=Thermophagus xiamenensis TaxID=385682 RepID=A0A1I2BES5_9BACT|nr:DUF4861 domain-containing protein [Thermophagus xiamenensis]SFE54702.1 protein of unknown function [Thermophagus xiamenensis]
MKRIKIILGVAVFLLLWTSSCSKKQLLVVSNPLDVERIDETIIVKRTELEQRYGEIPDGYAVALKLDNKYVPSQVDDMDGDGIWDELVFTLDFKPSETLSLNVVTIPENEYPDFPMRTNIQLGILQSDSSYKEVDKYDAPSISEGFKIIAQGESVSWENDKMGFRNYFDVRNIKDLFGKLKPDIILDKLHTPDIPNYHELSDWGMDILHCGSSLGAGGLAMLEADSLYRLGSTEKYSFEKITEGPVRSVFDLKYEGWKVANQSLSAVERITIYPGKYWFMSDVTVSDFEGTKQLVTGIVTSKLTNDPFEFKAEPGYRVIGTHDRQSENNDELGMAVMLKDNEVTRIARTTDINFFERGYQTVVEKGFSHVISETYYVAQKIKADKPARHYFFAVWGLENEKWKNPENFKAYISSEAEKIGNPVVIN